MCRSLTTALVLSACCCFASCTQSPETKRDLSIPRFTPKPVIWLADWKGETPQSPARVAAAELMRKADFLKSEGKYYYAEGVYQAAMQADPTWSYPPYQQACNFELQGKFPEAWQQLQRYPTALTDDELGSMRARTDFQKILRQVRERYIQASATKVGQPIAVKPTGAKPAGGWPVMLLLHGYGDTNVSYLDHAEVWAEQGFVAVTVPGSTPIRDGSFIWDLISADPTQQDLQAILQSPLLAPVIDKQQVFVQGFSQGGLHAMMLTIEHPDQYAGVVSVAPGGSFADKIVQPTLPTATQPIHCVFIHGDREAHAPMVDNWRTACAAANWKFMSSTHPGGHHYPENWVEMLPEVAKFLRGM